MSSKKDGAGGLMSNKCYKIPLNGIKGLDKSETGVVTSDETENKGSNKELRVRYQQR